VDQLLTSKLEHDKNYRGKYHTEPKVNKTAVLIYNLYQLQRTTEPRLSDTTANRHNKPLSSFDMRCDSLLVTRWNHHSEWIQTLPRQLRRHLQCHTRLKNSELLHEQIISHVTRECYMLEGQSFYGEWQNRDIRTLKPSNPVWLKSENLRKGVGSGLGLGLGLDLGLGLQLVLWLWLGLRLGLGFLLFAFLGKEVY